MSAPTHSPYLPFRDVIYKASKFAAVLSGVLLISLGAHLDIPMVPVPMSMQTYAILVIAALSGWRLAGLITIAYLVLGALGVPVFADGASGTAHLYGKTAGYLYGFVLTAIAVGFLTEKGWTQNNPLQSVVVMMMGHLIILVPGTLWLAQSLGIQAAYQHGMAPFLVGALAKSVLASATIWFMKRRR